MIKEKRLICRIAAAPFSVNKFLRTQIESAIDNGYEVLVITGQDAELQEFCVDKGVKYERVNIERRFAPFQDLVSLIKLILVLRKYNVSCIHTISSKGGLLGVLAGRLLRIPCIIHIYAGLPWCEMKGIKRFIGKYCDKLIGIWSTFTYADSFSERNFIIKEAVCEENKIKVLGEGSVSGFDIERFNRAILSDQASIERKKMEICQDHKVILFVGRTTKEKGVGELVSAFLRVSEEIPELSLVLVGPLEEDIDPLSADTKQAIESHVNIHHVGYKSNPEVYYALADYLVLPSYREGFGNVVIEAAIAEIPTIGTNIFGLSDSIQENITGLLVKPKDVESLYIAMKELIINDTLRKELGNNARRRAVQFFSKDYMNKLLIDEYNKYIK